MKIVVSDVDWDVEDDMDELEISYDEAVKQFDLPTDSFIVEIDYELEDDVNGPTDEEFEEINDLVADAISDEYGFCVNNFSWGLYEY